MQAALHELALQDKHIRCLYEQYGVPPLWSRPQNFATLVHIILEQKVSLASADAVMRRVRHVCPGMKPLDFLKVDVDLLQDAGMSRSKISYCQSIAERLASKQLQLAALRKLPDQSVIEQLTMIKGIGPWTAGVYLMMALRRPDAWASGDRALAVSYQESAELACVPSYPELDKIARYWSPHRGSVARLLWHAYLTRRRPS